MLRLLFFNGDWYLYLPVRRRHYRAFADHAPDPWISVYHCLTGAKV